MTKNFMLEFYHRKYLTEYEHYDQVYTVMLVFVLTTLRSWHMLPVLQHLCNDYSF